MRPRSHVVVASEENLCDDELVRCGAPFLYYEICSAVLKRLGGPWVGMSAWWVDEKGDMRTRGGGVGGRENKTTRRQDDKNRDVHIITGHEA